MTASHARSLRKTFREGTHRIVSPDETLRRYLPHASRMGITRLANVTGLDFLGVPVFMAARPNSRSLSVFQGKGLGLAAAKASALMESAEMFHAETARPALAAARLADLKHDGPPIDWERLPGLTTHPFSPDREIAWIEARDLMSGEKLLAPFDLAHADYTVERAKAPCYFPVGSTGLPQAITISKPSSPLSSNLSSAMRRLCGRDGRVPTTLRAAWMSKASADAPRALIDQLRGKGIRISAWDITTDVGIAAFLCRIEEADASDPSPLPPFHGAGCHLDRSIALCRAVTEAAQARLTLISGSRDDLERRNYSETAGGALLRLLYEAWERRFPARKFEDVPSVVTEFLEDDIEIVLGKLKAIGVSQVIAVDLTRPEIALPVVRMIAPGLEFDDIEPDYRLGERAQRIAAAIE